MVDIESPRIDTWTSDDARWIGLKVFFSDGERDIAIEAERMPNIIASLLGQLESVAKRRPGMTIDGEARVATTRVLDVAFATDQQTGEPLLIFPIGPALLGFQVPLKSLQGICARVQRMSAGTASSRKN